MVDASRVVSTISAHRGTPCIAPNPPALEGPLGVSGVYYIIINHIMICIYNIIDVFLGRMNSLTVRP